VKVDEWLSFFKHHREKSLFSLSDLTQLTGEHAASLSVQLTRLVKAGAHIIVPDFSQHDKLIKLLFGSYKAGPLQK